MLKLVSKKHNCSTVVYYKFQPKLLINKFISNVAEILFLRQSVNICSCFVFNISSSNIKNC